MINEEQLLTEARERAERAKRYAEKFPMKIMGGEDRFQRVEWQEGHLRKVYNLPKKVNKEDEEVNKRKEYMRKYMAKKRSEKMGGEV